MESVLWNYWMFLLVCVMIFAQRAGHVIVRQIDVQCYVRYKRYTGHAVMCSMTDGDEKFSS